jgi:chromate transporter
MRAIPECPYDIHWNASNPILVAATRVIGLVAFPILQPAWGLVK